MTFNNSIHHELAIFEPYLAQSITIYTHCFSQQTQTVQQFVNEIEQTAQILSKLTQNDMAEFYSDRLILQYRTLQKGIERLKNKTHQNEKMRKKFQSSYRFPKNIHAMRPSKRLEEYKKALRLLNDKISWIIEQGYDAQTMDDKTYWQIKLQETDFRKQKCLDAIEKTEEELLKSR
ncbi:MULTISPECIES: primosomal replication protein PriC [Pasteurellaceae]|uniref:Primosomal replication protein n=1 Tax=Pasteurella atlantica TaxID=2827233 RepID=A0AAW8CGK9_9PAST|nr:primosomal replication protein PriC [Pasteurella atlantica]MBR0573844.1 primosomal replication protein [Pasteurella atlantica]MDP8039236.1 primosomal replication protein [Pasteurella atlantica]MDP8041327.1 primosomal replication protein [Pasteurella atlantica]MDP8043463.1 primosomal replication protein [Pasteurella atlantica]MDP8045618.1 primosomal replication protein [Pasteurella atlantica]